MAFTIYQPRFDAPVGSTIVYPDGSGSVIEYTNFPSGWEQTGGTAQS